LPINGRNARVREARLARWEKVYLEPYYVEIEKGYHA
jgi:hypothetical protein